MLKEFKVKGFKNFNEEIIFELGDCNNYEFNKSAIKNGISKTALIYGKNGSGKSNLGYAIFDIVSHLTDKNRGDSSRYDLYLNLDSNHSYACFSYVFQFDNDILEYNYSKTDYESLMYEEVIINEEVVIRYDYDRNVNTIINLYGAETLDKELNNHKISFVKYIIRNANLDKSNHNNVVFNEFFNFVNKMLFFRSLKENEYIGFKNGSDYLFNVIVNENKLNEFEKFLAANGVFYNLEAAERDDKKMILCRFKSNKSVDLNKVASTGTVALTLFFYWRIFLEDVSFVFIDEFDAFYHSDVAEYIVRLVKEQPNLQGILTTHNTDIMNNDLLRPDCYFNLENGKIKSIAKSTEKELRLSHNLQKMYKAGAFAR